MEREKKNKIQKITAITAFAVLLTALVLTVTVNFVLIVKTWIEPTLPPDFFGIAPMTAPSDDMKGDRAGGFDRGAMVLVKVLDEREKPSLRAGEVVCCRQGNIFIFRRILRTETDEEGNLLFVTKGDHPLATENEPVPTDRIFGRCVYSVEGMGAFFDFFRAPGGFFIFVAVTLSLFVGCATLYLRATDIPEGLIPNPEGVKLHPPEPQPDAESAEAAEGAVTASSSAEQEEQQE